MHEYSIVQSLMSRVDAEARARGATAVRSLEVRIGELAGVDGELLRTAFEHFRERTVCTDARLDIRAVPAVWSCSGCGRQIERGERLCCAACGRPARLVSGDEIVLERIEMEVPDV